MKFILTYNQKKLKAVGKLFNQIDRVAHLLAIRYNKNESKVHIIYRKKEIEISYEN